MPSCILCSDAVGRHYTEKLNCICTNCKNDLELQFYEAEMSLFMHVRYRPKFFRSKKAAQLYLIEKALFD